MQKSRHLINEPKIKDQYLFDKNLMLCPMTHPMYYGAGSEKIEDPVTTRRVYLPAGNDWFDFCTLERYTGYGYEQGDYKLTRVFWDDENRKLSVNR